MKQFCTDQCLSLISIHGNGLKLLCCCSERQIPCLSISGESGAVSVYNANHICTALPSVSSGEEPHSSFNCFSALTTTTVMLNAQ